MEMYSPNINATISFNITGRWMPKDVNKSTKSLAGSNSIRLSQASNDDLQVLAIFLYDRWKDRKSPFAKE